jgi:iron complex outermembrane receptor protein
MRRISVIMVSGILGLAEAAAPAFAQTAPVEKGATDVAGSETAASKAVSPAARTAPVEIDAAAGEVVVVSGVRLSLQKAVQKKRNSEVISDVISAEDIGKFPDQNLAESLQHITGVQISRSKGEGQNVSIRGLDPQFNRVMFNGRELTSPTGDRSFGFSNLSSTFVNSIEVYKSPSADMTEGGLAGTINIVTAKPLDIGKRRISASVEGLYDKNSQKATPHVSMLYNDVFMDKTWGLTLGVDVDKKTLTNHVYEAFGLEPRPLGAMAPSVSGGNTSNLAEAIRFNHAANFAVQTAATERRNALATVQFKPTSTLELTLNMLYSDFQTDERRPLNALRFTNIGGTAPAVVGYQNDGGILTYLDAHGVDHRNNSRQYSNHDKIFSPSLALAYRGSNWKLDGELSSSRAEREFNSLALEVIARADASQDLRKNPGKVPDVVFQRGYNQLDPNNFVVLGLNGAYQQPNSEKNRSGRLDFTYSPDFDFVKSLHFGVKSTTNTESVRNNNVSISAKVLAGALGVPYNANVEGGSFAAAPYMRVFSPSNFLSDIGSNAAFQKTWISSDANLLFDKVPLSALLAQSPPTANLASVYDIQETSNAAYGKATFEALDGALSGNLGVRLVRTTQKSSGYAPDLSKIIFSQQGATTTIPNVTAITVERSYTNVLPSLNLRYDLAPSLVSRFSAARVMSRPNLSILAPNTNVNANVRTISGGNPKVNPYLADQYDVSLEWYLPKSGLLSAAVFYKDVSNFIVSTSKTQNLTVNLAEGGGSTTLPFTVLQPDNGAGSKVKGLELGYQQPFTFLPKPWNNFGAIVNFTYVDAAPVRIVENGPLIALPGVSKINYNLTAYYDDSKFSTRLSYTFRDKFVVDSSSYFGDGQFTNAYKQLDLSASYKLSEALSINFHALNLNNSAVVNVDQYGINRGVEVAGRRYTLGAQMTY